MLKLRDIADAERDAVKDEPGLCSVSGLFNSFCNRYGRHLRIGKAGVVLHLLLLLLLLLCVQIAVVLVARVVPHTLTSGKVEVVDLQKGEQIHAKLVRQGLGFRV